MACNTSVHVNSCGDVRCPAAYRCVGLLQNAAVVVRVRSGA